MLREENQRTWRRTFGARETTNNTYTHQLHAFQLICPTILLLLPLSPWMDLAHHNSFNRVHLHHVYSLVLIIYLVFNFSAALRHNLTPAVRHNQISAVSAEMTMLYYHSIVASKPCLASCSIKWHSNIKYFFLILCMFVRQVFIPFNLTVIKF